MSFFQNTEAIYASGSTGGYLNPGKLTDGQSIKFRILGIPVEGWEYWNTDGKPVRLAKAPSALPSDIRYRDGKPEKVKFFAAFPVWSYPDSAVQICQLTQKSILQGIDAYASHEDYGNPIGYDLTLTRKGKGLETEYSIIASPPKPFPHEADAIDALAALNFPALFTGGNPFGGGGGALAVPGDTPPHLARIKEVRERLGFSKEWVLTALAATPGFPPEPRDLTPEQAEALVTHMENTAAGRV